LTQQFIDYEAADQRARERIREALDETLFVEAGAGTGKTSALVDRVVALVLAGRSIERVVAITFTEKAAAELRDRIRGGLEKAKEAQPDRSEVIDSALESLDRAQVSTIHSFCQALLYSFAAEAGIDPSFQVQDEVMAERRFQERWRIYLEGLGEDEEASRAIDRALGLGLTTWNLAEFATALTDRPELAGRLERSPLGAQLVEWPDLLAMAAELEALPLDRAPPDDELRRRVGRLASLVMELARADEDEREALVAAGAEVIAARWNVSSREVWGREACGLVRDTASRIARRLDETLSGSRSEALAEVLPLIVRFVLDDALARGREGTLTFDDLILRVRDLLRTNRDAVTKFRARHDVLLVDEFQDTDPLQVEIALTFAIDPDTGVLEPGRLFLVGDPKQSIYRFRRADMAIYSHTREQIESQGGGFPSLALNRRSRAKVLEWVNGVFEGMIGPGLDQSVQPPYRRIHPSRDGAVAGPGVAWLGGEAEGKNAREVREIEAGSIAAHCLAAIEEGWEVVDRDGDRRPSLLRDIAVLIPARTILPVLERTLVEAGIPYRVESGSLIYRTQEVRDLLNCLTAIDDPADEVAVVAALRSPAYACSDVELAKHKATGGNWNYLSPRLDEWPGRVGDALRDLRRYHEARHDKSLAAVIEGFLADRGQVEVGILDSGNRNSFRRARFIVDQARAFEAAAPESLRAFVSWMERRAGEAILDNEGAGLDDDEDAVRVMTIHGAKGLEFPIVFVAGLGAPPLNRPGAFMVDRASDDIAVCIGAKSQYRQFQLGPVERLSDLEKGHTDAEYARLLYVAATRARDHLVVSLYHRSGASSACGAKRLIEHRADQLAERRPDLALVERNVASPFADLEVDEAKELMADEFEATRRRLVTAATQRRYTSATAMGYQRKEEKTDETEPWSRGRGGTRLGRAVHAAIQSLPLDADSTLIAAFSRAQAVAEAIPHRAREVERLVDWALRSSQAAARARSAGRALREVPFALALDGTVLEGFIDLVIESGDGIEIVDWKTDDLQEGEVDSRLDEYRVQAGLYVYGLETALQRPVSQVTYVFAKPRVERSLGDPNALRTLGEGELLRQQAEVAGATPASAFE
jgi:ATP-dependent helicase/nuclease subunit A